MGEPNERRARYKVNAIVEEVRAGLSASCIRCVCRRRRYEDRTECQRGHENVGLGSGELREKSIQMTVEPLDLIMNETYMTVCQGRYGVL